MKNSSLIKILEELERNSEVSIEVSSCGSGKQIALTYDVDYEITSSGELKLKIAIE